MSRIAAALAGSWRGHLSADANRLAGIPSALLFRVRLARVLTPQNTETQMRKLKIIEHISLDGVIQVSGEDGDFPYGD